MLGVETDAELGFVPTRRGGVRGAAPQSSEPASIARIVTSEVPSTIVLDDSPTGSHHTVMVREMTDAFRRLDNRFGGSHGFGAINAYLDDEVEPRVVRGHYGAGVRSDFLRAAAELNQLAGWMAYDVGAESLGRARLRAALELAAEADDDALAAEMIAALGHHAAFCRSAGEAIELALAAQRLARRSGSPSLRAESAVLLAHGFALEGDRPRSTSAMSRAEERMADGYERGRVFNTALLATILVDTAEIDEAIHYGRVALDLARRVGSSRARTYLREVHDRLHPLESLSDASLLRAEIARFSVAPSTHSGR